MSKKVAIIGAGPSGLAAAKSALECCLEPTVFEAAEDVGGLWRPKDGLVWTTLRTNLSKWTCSFSDHEWPEGTPDFPRADQLHGYLADYASRFGIRPFVRMGHRVTQLVRRDDGWIVTLQAGAAKTEAWFDFVIVATGVFGPAHQPSFPGSEKFQGRILHSSGYRDGSDWRGKTMVVVGSSSISVRRSGCKSPGLPNAASKYWARLRLAVFRRPTWIIPCRVAHEGGSLPSVHFRLWGPNADPDRALQTIRRVWDIMGIS